MQNLTGQNRYALKKPPFNCINKIVSTAFGKFKVCGPVDPDQLAKYRLAEGLCCFRNNCRQHQALIKLTEQSDGLVFTTTLADIVVSYLSFQKPDYPWWFKRCFPELLELGSIETDLSWRRMGLSKMLLSSLFDNPDFKFFEDYIVIAVLFIQSWDLKNTGISPWAYHRFMSELFKRYGFTSRETVDPEIREHPCNFLLARIGDKTTPGTIKHFDNCCLGTNGTLC